MTRILRLSILCIVVSVLTYRPSVSMGQQQAALPDFRQVDFYFTQNPQLFQNLWNAARTQTVRIAVIGDSQETSPTSHGFQYIPRINYEMWHRFGNVPETPIEGCFYYVTTPPGDWLMAGGCTTPGPAATRLKPGQILPNVIPKAFSTLNSQSNITKGSHGQLSLLEPNAVSVDPSAEIPTDTSYVDTSGSVKAQIFAATNASSGEVSYIARPTSTAFPSYSAAPTTTGTLTLGLQSTEFAVKSGSTAALNFNGKRYMGLEVFGSDDNKLTDIIGLRFFNPARPEGVIVDTFSHGGYSADDFLGNHGNAGAMFKAFGFQAAVVHFGANGGATAADFQTKITAVIAQLRSWVGDSSFPVILIADVYQQNLSAAQASEYDKYVGAELAVAQADSHVMVINARRLMEDIGWNETSGQSGQFLLSDGIHYTAHGAQVLASAEVAAMMNEIQVPGCLSDPGAVSLPSTATLVMQLGGTAACSEYGQLAVAQSLSFNQSTLDVVLANGFTPTAGQQFKILSFGSASGAFGSVILPTLASELTWNTSALYTTGTIGVASSGASDTQAPTVPQGLTATNVTANGVTLSWSASTDLPSPGGSGIGGYYIYRNGNTATPIATVRSGTAFTDSGLGANTAYTYQVAAFDLAAPSNVSAPSVILRVTTQATSQGVFSPTFSGSIGAVGVAGSYTLSNGTFTVKGSGADIWGTADGFEFVAQPLSGDGSITARVASQTNTNSWAKAGVMFRETLGASSSFADVLVSPERGTAMQARKSTGASAVNTQGPTNITAPYWVRLVRTGNTFTGYRSSDGKTWTSAGQYSIPMASSVYVGLAVTSHNNGILSTAVFDNVTVSGGAAGDVTAPSVPAGLKSTAISASSVALSWSASADNNGGAGVGGYYVYRNNNTAVPYATVTGTTFTDMNVSASTTYFYQVAAFDKAAPSPNVSSASTPALSVVTPAASPATWTGGDIGAVGVAGSSALSNGVFTVKGSGANIWDHADALQFVEQTIVGDGSITAHVASQTRSDDYAKAGVMVRETLAAGSANAAVLLTPTPGAVLQGRTSTGGGTAHLWGPSVTAPCWVRLVRSGNVFTGYTSADGATWKAIGQYTIPMTARVDFGLAVTSHNNSALSTAVFDHVTVAGTGGGN